ncbi:pyridoxal phosphate-dependent aminotransferase [Proteiniphilum acetatigenes]|uniref:pyridoxal phosphate-dependent aminotransferase n=1 Tax=Proteiniphilum acetatigenes TaxID=294710 RepID=UPI000476E682|nr:aminotransferase class I/II-fold pyridoxal phosphate-dependent enzyme [Proteiniphilum acetatigenes]SFK41452.1 threonine-phosphate decarboxylase [Porphyromonadaceae bacterium KH3CP3RA]
MQTGHGNDIYNYPGAIRCDFSSNIPYRNASETIADYLKSRMDTIRNYPDPSSRKLTTQLADFHAVSPDNILVTNGSAEAFYLLAHLFQHRESVIPYPTFSEYEDACHAYRHRISFLPVESLQDSVHFNADTVWFGVPNNPDGTIVNNDAISRFCSENPHTSFIVDAAYDDLCPRNESVKSLQGRFRNLITVYSLTKTFGIPGLRLGYIIAGQQVIDVIRSLRPPWSVNALALAAGSFIMENRDRLLPDAVSLCAESARLQQEISALPQFEVTASPSNFFLVKMKERTAAELKYFLIDNFGLLIRDASNFRGLTPQYFRISVQEEAWNRQLIEALNLFYTG